MTPAEMEEKLRRYESALTEIVEDVWKRAVKEQDLRHAGATLEEISKGRPEFQAHIVMTAWEALGLIGKGTTTSGS